ncbi:MAG TPA: threonine synthase [Gemmatimonadales bacterium]|nr:threonine synthase [Gemmatimonadales bacterium]
MSATRQLCASCGGETPDTDPHSRCPRCRGLLEVRHRPPTQGGGALRALFDARLGVRRGPLASGVWRFTEVVLPAAGPAVLSYPEGNTPLLTSDAVAVWAGAPGLLLKHEGHNPTGSFKDRGMTVGVTQARRVQARAVACASTGNTGAALAAYAALAGLPALVIVPKGQVAFAKVAQALAYGARLLLVRGNFDQCLELVDQATERLGTYLLNSVNPFRIEGQKTIVLELLQQLAWEPPQWIAVPAGNLGNTAAFGKALAESCEWGLIDRLPRLAAIQAEGAAPFAASFREGFARRHRVEPHTVATAISIGNPASYDRAARAIRDTHGVVTTVNDDEILEAKAVVDAAGIGCEPASAAAVAGARRLVREGVIRPGERVVAVLTGHLLKDPDIVSHYHQHREPPPPRANRPVEIEPRLEEIERVMHA